MRLEIAIVTSGIVVALAIFMSNPVYSFLELHSDEIARLNVRTGEVSACQKIGVGRGRYEKGERWEEFVCGPWTAKAK